MTIDAVFILVIGIAVGVLIAVGDFLDKQVNQKNDEYDR